MKGGRSSTLHFVNHCKIEFIITSVRRKKEAPLEVAFRSKETRACPGTIFRRSIIWFFKHNFKTSISMFFFLPIFMFFSFSWCNIYDFRLSDFFLQWLGRSEKSAGSITLDHVELIYQIQWIPLSYKGHSLYPLCIFI